MTDPPDPAEQPGQPSRRGFVTACATAVVLAAGGGVAAGIVVRPSDSSRAPVPPAALSDAVTAELELLTTVHAARSTVSGARRAVLDALYADHQAHLTALQGAFGLAGGTPSPIATPSAPTGGVSWAEVRAAEHRAVAGAAHRALRLSGTNAALLASISACEAGHVTLMDLQ